MKILGLMISLSLGFSIYSQDNLKGTVFEYRKKGNEKLVGATVNWSGTAIASVTDINGQFNIPKQKATNQLVVSFVGMQSDTISIEKSTDSITIVLIPNLLDVVEINAKQLATQFNFNSTLIEIDLKQKELHKAACCNLSESFETNASVDVAYSDAATGSKQIKMLGLAGKYVSISKDNLPNVRGFNTHMGMMFIPGTWINGIQLTKGIGSVINGHEDLTGQINVQLIQPDTARKNDYNVYISNEGRIENNLVVHNKVSDRWQSNILLHQNSRLVPSDNNHDGFLDLPLGNQINIANLWKGYTKNDWMVHLGINYTTDRKQGGTTNNAYTNYPIRMNTVKEDFYLKMGKLYHGKPNKSMGIQIAQMYYDHKFSTGNRFYHTHQNSLFGNYIYQNIIGNTNHSYKLGINSTLDVYQHDLDTNFNQSINEANIGTFGEYQFKMLDKLTWIIGGRIDYSSLWQLQLTPRTNLRYAFNERFVVKLSSGTGYRTAFGLAENQSFLISSRPIVGGTDYTMEKAWTHGINLLYNYEVSYRKGSISADFYQTDFKQQLIVDQKSIFSDQQSANTINFLSQNEMIKPYSSSTLQVEVFQEIGKRVEVRAAYKYSSVLRSYYHYSIGIFQEQDIKTPLHRGFFNFYYKTKTNWELDYTLQITGKQQLIHYNEAPLFMLHNSQITKNFKKNKNAIYLGVENLFNFKQNNAIINADKPYSLSFDATQIWGPVFGRTIYIGLRYHF